MSALLSSVMGIFSLRGSSQCLGADHLTSEEGLGRGGGGGFE